MRDLLDLDLFCRCGFVLPCVFQGKEQFSAISAFLDKEAPDRKIVAAAMKYACEKYRYTFKQFRAAFVLVKTGQLSDNVYEATDVQKQDLKV